MDDEETIWKLDATSLSGFAIQSSPFALSTSASTLHPAHEEGLKWIHHSIEAVDIQVSQTLETHLFPYYLQISLLSRCAAQDPGSPTTYASSASGASTSSATTSISSQGVVLLLPLNHILNITISDHSSHGQTLRF